MAAPARAPKPALWIEARVVLADGSEILSAVPKHAGWRRSVLAGKPGARIVSHRECRE